MFRAVLRYSTTDKCLAAHTPNVFTGNVFIVRRGMQWFYTDPENNVREIKNGDSVFTDGHAVFEIHYEPSASSIWY